ncbi:hypothetical protein V6N13_029700 [Hibiscus sabdariffa]
MAAWPRRWEQIGGVTSVGCSQSSRAVWARETTRISEAWRRQLVLAGRFRLSGWVWGIRTTYGSENQGQQIHLKPMLGRGATTTKMATEGASGAGKTVSVEFQPTTAGVAVATLGFLVYEKRSGGELKRNNPLQ